MNCDSCKTNMNDTTTEMEISNKGRTIKAINVPVFSCPDYKEIHPRGAGITFGKS